MDATTFADALHLLIEQALLDARNDADLLAEVLVRPAFVALAERLGPKATLAVLEEVRAASWGESAGPTIPAPPPSEAASPLEDARRSA